MSWESYIDTPITEKIMICEDALDQDTCQKFRSFAATKEREAIGIAYRKTYRIDHREIDGWLQDVLHDVFALYVEPFFGMEIDYWEKPQLFSYTEGDAYQPHNDGGWQKGADGRQKRGKFNRDISLIIYLNDAFSGGNLYFPHHNIRIQPKSGLVVAFPSTSDYEHEVELTQSGERLALVTWATVAGTPRVEHNVSKTYMKNMRTA